MATFTGTAGDDVLSGVVGVDDTLDGGAGTDTASYVGAGGVIVDLSNGVAFDLTNFDIDTLISIENVTGSAFGDILIGDAGANVLDGGAGSDTLDGGDGNDTLIGGPGNDTLIGGNGTDTVSYAGASAGVMVDLGASLATNDGDGGSDTLGGIENVTGSVFVDNLTGDGFANVLTGGVGNDTLAGGGSADVFRYSFNLTQGGGESETFTDFIGQGGSELTDNFYTQSLFATQYTAWLEHLVDTFGLGSDANGDGIVKVGLNQNDAAPDATPFIEGVSAEELAAMFTDRDNVFLNTGKVTQERFYSNTLSSGDGEDTAASADGFDTIVDFVFGEDKLEFDGLAGLTLAQFTSLFTVNQTDVNGDGTMDTVLALADDTWSATLENVSGHTIDEFYTTSVFS